MPRKIPSVFFQGKVLKSEISLCSNGREKTEFSVLDTDKNKKIECINWGRYVLNPNEYVIVKGFFLKQERENPIFIVDYVMKRNEPVKDFYSNFGKV